MQRKQNAKTCPNGHRFYKSSTCPTCPVCEQERTPAESFLDRIAAPARRALENAGIVTLKDLSQWTEQQISDLHGMGPSTLPKLKKELRTQGLGFKKK